MTATVIITHVPEHSHVALFEHNEMVFYEQAMEEVSCFEIEVGTDTIWFTTIPCMVRVRHNIRGQIAEFIFTVKEGEVYTFSADVPPF